MMKVAMKKNKAVRGLWSAREKRGPVRKVLTGKVIFEYGPESGREEARSYPGNSKLDRGRASTKVLRGD